MEEFKSFQLENSELILGGEHWETGCSSGGKPTDIWDDVTERLVVFT